MTFKALLPDAETGYYAFEGLVFVDGEFHRTHRAGNQKQYTNKSVAEQKPLSTAQAKQFEEELPKEFVELYKKTQEVPVEQLQRIIENLIFVGNSLGVKIDEETYIDASETEFGAEVAWELDLLQTAVETVLALRQLNK